VDILEDDGPSVIQQVVQPLAWSLYLVACAVVASGIAEYRRHLPLAQERGLPTSVMVKESFRRFDPAFAALGLAVGIATLAILVWSRRGRSIEN